MHARLSTAAPGKHRRLARELAAALLTLASLGALPEASFAATSNSSAAAAAHPSRAYWRDVSGKVTTTAARGLTPSIQPDRYRALALDRSSLAALAATAPAERSDAARYAPLIISLPDPSGGFQRFSLVDSPVMEAGLAARHPEIRTYAGKGIDDSKATIRVSITPLGLQASVRSPSGSWYIDPSHHLDDSTYVSYYRADLRNPRTALGESLLNEPQISLNSGRFHASDTVQVSGVGFAPGAQVRITVQNIASDSTPRQTVYATATRDGTVSAKLAADPYKTTGSYSISASVDGGTAANSNYIVVSDATTTNAATGAQLRTYRLALVTDPSYATYFGGSANVTAAKVALVNRVTQVYEYETSIRLVLVADNDKLNLDTVALATGTNGPCGATACFTATNVSTCSSGTLTRNRTVVGLLVGADKYDIGHIALGNNGGGIASLGVVGAASKAQGCTGVPTPVGDYYAVDYVAHEMGHQFAGNHTFNGTISNCSTSNRNAGTSVEPGSGSSIMAYAGICGTDNLQPHSDPYWSQRSFDEITTYTSTAETNLSEVQLGALTGYTTAGQQFVLNYNGQPSAPIVRGTNNTAAGIKAAVEAISGWPTGGTVTASAVADSGFTLTFGGALVGVDVPTLTLSDCTGGCSGYVSTLTQGGATRKGGTATPTTNNPPVVTTTASYTIPVRTPFALTGSATDPDGDPLTYMWEQNDRGATGTSAGTGLITQPKLNGPLFRQFGTAAVVSTAQSQQYSSPGENLVDGNPTRVFPDIAQVLANNTNAETGACPTAAATPTAADIDCFSEYLPTAAYVGAAGVNASPASLNFRLTARDSKGGVASASTQLILAATAGPFLVTSHNAAASYDVGSAQTVTWSVANTDVAPVNASNVKISLSTDGGLTYPYVLAASTPNTGSKAVALPAGVTTTQGRVKVEAVGNVFFDVSNANITLKNVADINNDGSVTCADVSIVKASFGKKVGDAGFNALADVTNDGVVDLRDLALVTRRLASGTSCL